MDPSFSQPAHILPQPPHPIAAIPESATPAPWRQDLITRVTALTPQDAAAGLLWLAMNDPAACGAMLDKLDDDAIRSIIKVFDPGHEPVVAWHQGSVPATR